MLQLYNEQAQAVVGESGVEVATPEARAQQASLLTQARDTLYLTLDRLRMPGETQTKLASWGMDFITCNISVWRVIVFRNYCCVTSFCAQ